MIRPAQWDMDRSMIDHGEMSRQVYRAARQSNTYRAVAVGPLLAGRTDCAV